MAYCSEAAAHMHFGSFETVIFMAVSITFVVVWDMTWNCLAAKHYNKYGGKACMGNFVRSRRGTSQKAIVSQRSPVKFECPVYLHVVKKQLQLMYLCNLAR